MAFKYLAEIENILESTPFSCFTNGITAGRQQVLGVIDTDTVNILFDGTMVYLLE